MIQFEVKKKHIENKIDNSLLPNAHSNYRHIFNEYVVNIII